MKNRTTVERKSERELVVTRTFDAPARIVFEAWTRAELFRRWWVPKSFGLTLLSCEMDVRVAARTASSSATRRPEADGVLRPVPRGDAALAPRLDQRGSGRRPGRSPR